MNANHLPARLTIRAQTSIPNQMRNRNQATSAPIFLQKLSVSTCMLESGNRVLYFLEHLMRLEALQVLNLMLRMTLSIETKRLQMK
jgi:hypothetical protein